MHIVFQNIISRATTIETKSPMRQKNSYKLNSLKRKTNLFYIITEELAMSLRLYLSPRFSVPVTRMEHQSNLVWLLVYKYNLRKKPTFIEVVAA